FLFIITPKVGSSPSLHAQAVISLDTIQKQLFGTLDDSLYMKLPGDTLLVVIKNFKEMPGIMDCPDCPPARECPPKVPCPKCPEIVKADNPNDDHTIANPVDKKAKGSKEAEAVKVVDKKEGNSGYKGDPPAVPCNVSFEINWKEMDDNVDLIVCKDGDCVHGGKRKRKNVGQWSSGITPTNIFGTDFRTTQEAVRQFREIIPGKYTLKAVFKESEKKHKSVEIRGLVYTKSLDGKEKGEPFQTVLKLDPNKVVEIGTVDLKANGEFNFIKK
ncbi:MAG: hypothetical protein R2879_22815, partial [Saprospiraceae bacterium]